MFSGPTALLMFAGLAVLLLLWHSIGTSWAARVQATSADKPILTDIDVQAKKWLDETLTRLESLNVASSEASWQWATNITAENEATKTILSLVVSDYIANKSLEAYETFNASDISDASLRRAMKMVQQSRAGSTPEERAQVEEITNQLSTTYGTARICPPHLEDDCDEALKVPLTPNLDEIMSKSRNETALRLVWKRWRDAAGKPSKENFFDVVDRNTEYNKRIGYDTITERLLHEYEEDQPDFKDEIWKLWLEMLPFYEDIHAYVRYRLSEFYGEDIIKPDGTIPGHLLGNMWAQTWANIYDLVEPFPNSTVERPSVTEEMLISNYTVDKMFRVAENFFKSLGFPELPKKFWEKSMIERPDDREVVCHGSAWDMDYKDKRIKMCTQINEEDLGVVHHEQGHIYYYLAYENQSVIFRDGANSGFHEAVGDTIFISSSQDSYLKQLGLLPSDFEAPEELEINAQMQKALSAVMFLPFGYLVDLWRWDVYNGKVPKDQANNHWWSLRNRYQGIHAPVEREADDFDPTAKYHVSNFVPYIRYFVARFLQYQFHDALCNLSASESPDISTCSIFGSKEAGDRLWKMLSMGSSKPWTEALKVVTGSEEMSAEPLMRFFDKLRKWLRQENEKNGVCIGWGAQWPDSVQLNGPRCQPDF